MTASKHQPGCCCSDCGNCNGGTAPAEIDVTFPTPSNNDCSDCANLAGTYRLTRQAFAGTSCLYQYTDTVTLCSTTYDRLIELRILSTGTVTLSVYVDSGSATANTENYLSGIGDTFAFAETFGSVGSPVDCSDDYDLTVLGRDPPSIPELDATWLQQKTPGFGVYCYWSKDDVITYRPV